MCDYLHPGWLDPLYKPHFVCFDCRKQFKLRDEDVERFWARRAAEYQPGRSTVASRCPDCRAFLVPVCRCFEPPRKTQIKRWKALRADYLVRGQLGAARGSHFTYL